MPKMKLQGSFVALITPFNADGSVDFGAFRTLLEHSDLDQAHRDEFYRTLDHLPLSHEQSALLVVSGFWTMHLVIQLLEDVLEEYRPQRARRASVRRRAVRA